MICDPARPGEGVAVFVSEPGLINDDKHDRSYGCDKNECADE